MQISFVFSVLRLHKETWNLEDTLARRSNFIWGIFKSKINSNSLFLFAVLWMFSVVVCFVCLFVLVFVFFLLLDCKTEYRKLNWWCIFFWLPIEGFLVFSGHIWASCWRCDLTFDVFSYQCRSQINGSGLFLVATNNRTRNNGKKMEHGKFLLT